ncbi:hypothetical protein RvY_06285 [Ramazzottius varieornatus]|uniref:Uncharacterized protein n=1 Tax=Ramazzottius varieornatus TaxID=947166 RepID=A0A1D1UXZ9_RAMVA|nr:hypothetical protein RvY_06285 [Ramazzottius varieornatus]
MVTRIPSLEFLPPETWLTCFFCLITLRYGCRVLKDLRADSDVSSVEISQWTMTIRNSSQSEAMILHNVVSPDALRSWVVCSLLLLTISSILNSRNLLALLAHQRRRPWTSWYVLLAHLYVIDLFCSSILYTSSIVKISSPYWEIWGHRVFCQIVGFICTYTAICSSTKYSGTNTVYRQYRRRLPVSHSSRGI